MWKTNFVILALMERLHTPPLHAVLLCEALTTIPFTDLLSTFHAFHFLLSAGEMDVLRYWKIATSIKSLN
jgi:hypothetical protein